MLSFLLELIYPRLCVVCSCKLHRAEDILCLYCAQDLPTYDEALYSASERLYASPLFGQLYTLFAYSKGNHTAQMIHAFKYGGYGQAAQVFAELLYRKHQLDSAAYDLILAVPINHKRLLERGYNQTLLIARALGKRLNLPYSDKYIVCTKVKRAQAHLSKLERLGNPQTAFALAEKKHKALQDKRILLVDDVLTTGATLMAMMDLLEKAGAASVDVCTVAVTI